MDPCASREVSVDRQSIVLEGPERIHVSPKCDITKRDFLQRTLYNDVTTVNDILLRGERVSNDGRCYGWRPSGTAPYKWIRYSETRLFGQYFGSALIAKGFSPSSESKIGIYSQNRPEWRLADVGCMMFSMVTVPLYSTLGPEGRHHIINLVKMSLIVVDTIQKVNDLLEQCSKLPTLKCIIVMQTSIPDDILLRARNARVELLTFDALMEIGERNVKEPMPPKPEDVAVIRFTSGTTGNPKGVVITHANVVAGVAALASVLQHNYKIKPGVIGISYLPLAHAYEHISQMLLLISGGAVGFFRGNIDELLLDIQELKPNVIALVPRMANRFYDMCVGRLNSSPYIWRKKFASALAEKKEDIQRGNFSSYTRADQEVFKEEKDVLGGNIECLTTGGAPIASEVKLLLAAVYGCPVVEGYGLTESSGVTSMIIKGDPLHGHVGGPVPCNMAKLIDVADMGYFASQDKGEVCLKGTNIFQGYYLNPEKTAEALDDEGWFHTGDIGEWLPNGTLKLIDRKKHIYKLSQGEYIAPEKVENILMRSVLISQAFVYGESLRSYNVAIFVPDEAELKKFAEENKLSRGIGELCKNEVVRSAIRADIDRLSKAAKLTGVEKIGKFILHPELFSIDNGLLTPTMKSKRTAIRDRFRSEIDAMYGGLEQTKTVTRKHKL